MSRNLIIGILCFSIACSCKDMVDIPEDPPRQQQWELSQLDRYGYEWEFVPSEGSLADCGEIGLDESNSQALHCCAEHFSQGNAFRVRFKERKVYFSDLGPTCYVIDRVLLGNDRGDLRIEELEPFALEREYRVRDRLSAVGSGFPVRQPWLRSMLGFPILVPNGEDLKGTVRVVVGPDGDVIHCALSNAEGGAVPSELATSVCRAASRLSYAPATVFGLPVRGADEFAFERTGARVVLREFEQMPLAAWE